MMGAGASTKTPVRALKSEVAVLTDPVDPVFVREFQESTVHQPMLPSVHGGGHCQQPPHAGGNLKGGDCGADRGCGA